MTQKPDTARLSRDPERTKRIIIDAAAKEFAAKGFDATTMVAVARRAKVSKQLVHHHFTDKEALFRAVRETKFRPAMTWDETLPESPTDVFAARFEMRVRDLEYVRFLTWEAASARRRALPNERDRQKRLDDYGAGLRAMQERGLVPTELDPDLLQLAIVGLATYPLAFGQITRLITGQSGSDPEFQKRWAAFLRLLADRLFGADSG